MSIKEVINQKNEKEYAVRQSRRHPVSGKPMSLQRIARTKAEAIRLEKILIQELSDKIHRQIVPTWEVLLGKYEEHARDVLEHTEKTIGNAIQCLKAYTLPEWENRTVDKISKDEIRQLILTKLANKSEGHQRNLLKFIRSVFRLAEELDLVDRNPTPVIKFKRKEKLKAALNLREVSLLLSKAKELNNPWYPHWCLVLYTGLRNGEAYALTWDNVSFEERRIYVRRSWNSKDGFKTTKSGDERAVYIADELLPVLRELKLQSNGREFVLPRIPRWEGGIQAEELRKFLTGIGLPQIRFHDLRASWATLLINRGVEPAKIMVMGGWKDYKTMMIYIRKAGIEIQGATNALKLHDPLAQSVNLHKFAPSLQAVVSQ